MTEPSERAIQPEPRQAHGDPLDLLQPAIDELKAVNPDLALALTGLVSAVSAEAARNKRLATALSDALGPQRMEEKVGAPRAAPTRRTRRSAGPWDPFSVYAEHGEQTLRDRLSALDLEQLRDILAEHGMDTDRLAMKWRDTGRVVNRIVERVMDRAAKGDAFRTGPDQ